MLKKVLSVIIAIILSISVLLCCTVIIKSALGYDKSILGYRVFYIVSGSMEPTIHTGAAVLVQKSDEYVLDDIITFESSDSAIYGYPNTHRIIEVVEENGENVFITKGDANPVADIYTVPKDAIYGKVVFHTGEMYWLGTLIGMMTTPLGFITVIILPILAIIAIMVRDFTKEYKEALIAEVNSKMNAQNIVYVPQETAQAALEQTEVQVVQTPQKKPETEEVSEQPQEQTETEEAPEQPQEETEAEENTEQPAEQTEAEEIAENTEEPEKSEETEETVESVEETEESVPETEEQIITEQDDIKEEQPENTD